MAVGVSTIMSVAVVPTQAPLYIALTPLTERKTLTLITKSFVNHVLTSEEETAHSDGGVCDVHNSPSNAGKAPNVTVCTPLGVSLTTNNANATH